MGIAEKIKELEHELSNTKRNKATEKHIGILYAKIAKFKRLLFAAARKSGGGGGGFAVSKTGDATAALVGFPSVGKSTLLSKITSAESKSAEYTFTTVSVIPGVLLYNKAKIQILDLPGLIEGASEGKGRGKEVISMARSADLILILLDVFNAERDFEVIIRELNKMAIRPDKKPPEIYIEKKDRGGISLFHSSSMKINDEVVKSILNEYSIHNANVIIREEPSPENLVDAIETNRVYIPSLVIINKIDLADAKRRKELEKKFPNAVIISAEKEQNLEELKKRIYERLEFIRIYTKPLGGQPDLDEPVMLRKKSTVRTACLKIHTSLEKDFKYALVWGKSAKFPGQKVGLDHRLEEGDILSIVAR